MEDQRPLELLLTQIDKVDQALAIIIVLTFCCSQILSVAGLSQARKPHSRKSQYCLLAGFGHLNDHLVVQRIDHCAVSRVPDQVVMNATESIISIYDFSLKHDWFILVFTWDTQMFAVRLRLLFVAHCDLWIKLLLHANEVIRRQLLLLHELVVEKFIVSHLTDYISTCQATWHVITIELLKLRKDK